MSENPTKATYDLMLNTFTALSYMNRWNRGLTPLTGNTLHLSGVQGFQRYAVGFGPRFSGIAVPGHDVNGDPVFIFGRYSPYGMESSLILARDGRFRLGWLTPHIRGNVEQVSFLSLGYSAREYVWYAAGSKESRPGRIDDFQFRTPYVNEKMMRAHYMGMVTPDGQLHKDAMPGWFEVVENDDPKSRLAWKIQPANNQAAPGVETASRVADGMGAKTFDADIMEAQVNKLAQLREGRFNRDENWWRARNNLPPRRTKALKIRDDKEILVDQAAVTAIMANFSVSSPARITTLHEARQEATT